MPVILRIIFDRPYGAFYAGETVTGRVEVQVDKPTKIQAVTITFRGEAEVMWTETETVSSNPHRHHHHNDTHDRRHSIRTVTHSASEIYFSSKVYFVGADTGELTLKPGDHEYAFQCLLPNTLPNSFEGDHGYIRYSAKAVVHRPWKFDHSARAAFNVLSPLDLNMSPQAKVPIEREQSKHFCCLWCKSGPLTMSVRAPNGGYVPGQTILLQIQIDNASTTAVRNIRGTINQVVRWQATTKTKATEKRMVDLVFDKEVKAHDSRVFSQVITVPPVPPSHLNNCSIIDLEYLLTVTARVGGAHVDLEIKAPILIGTFPLMETIEYPPTHTYPDASAPPPGIPSPDLPPPSYEECVFKGNSIMNPKDGDNEYTMGIHSFTPRYPVWNLSSTAN
ncbi:Arrestin domain-containing protein 3 [Frankliniella fusca]|uniref:Arrestin domain-containing protein 3 n=1 Tax=Frankliniella fusca TaxID=407009 RepID=A0AAE1GWK2_9NEOP|nr:Arrestin domain-containing protein 3 [Frankliniella fusca]